MGRPRGAKNKMTKQRDESVQKLVKKFGDPLRLMFERRQRWKDIYDELTAEQRILSPHKKKLLVKAEEMLCRYDNDTMNYTRPKYQAINHTGDAAPIPAVIRAPVTISDNQEWLKKYGPKRDDAVNDRPAGILPFVKNVQAAYDTAKNLNIDDAQKILDEARKQIKGPQ